MSSIRCGQVLGALHCVFRLRNLQRGFLGGPLCRIPTTKLAHLLRIGRTPATIPFALRFEISCVTAAIPLARLLKISCPPTAVLLPGFLGVALPPTTAPLSLALNTKAIVGAPLSHMAGFAGLAGEVAREPSRQSFPSGDDLKLHAPSFCSRSLGLQCSVDNLGHGVADDKRATDTGGSQLPARHQQRDLNSGEIST